MGRRFDKLNDRAAFPVIEPVGMTKYSMVIGYRFDKLNDRAAFPVIELVEMTPYSMDILFSSQG